VLDLANTQTNTYIQLIYLSGCSKAFSHT